MIAETVLSGSLFLAIPLAAAAGLVSFLSPCVLPLVPGYLSYVTGLTGADIAAHRRGEVHTTTADGQRRVATVDDLMASRRWTMLAGSLLFIAGFTAVFVAVGVFVGGIGGLLLDYSAVITRVLGALTIVLGLAFMGLIPGFNREFRVHRLPGPVWPGPRCWASCSAWAGPRASAPPWPRYSPSSSSKGAWAGERCCR